MDDNIFIKMHKLFFTDLWRKPHFLLIREIMQHFVVGYFGMTLSIQMV